MNSKPVYNTLMDSLMQADIFFFITSIAVVIGGLLISIILIYGILIFRDLLAISNKVKHETELIAMDIDEAREAIKKQGTKFSTILGFLSAIFNRAKKTKK